MEPCMALHGASKHGKKGGQKKAKRQKLMETC